MLNEYFNLRVDNPTMSVNRHYTCAFYVHILLGSQDSHISYLLIGEKEAVERFNT